MPDFFIGGAWTSAREKNTREIRCPADGSLVTTVDEATAADTEAAIRAARAAFDTGPWPTTSPAERGALLDRVADALERHRAEFARAESLDTGKRLVEAEYDVDDVTSVFRYYAKLAAEDGDSRRSRSDRPEVDSRVVHEPVGVCGLITPVELPAAADVVEGRPGAGRRQHLRPQAERADAVDRHPADARAGRGRACPPVWPTWCSAPGPTSARCCRPTPTSTWSRSPADSSPAASSWRPPPPR